MTWAKVTSRNDWGHVDLLVAGKPWKPREHDSVRVRLPDETSRLVKVSYQSESFSVSDMGHTYEGLNRIPGFRIDWHGLSLWHSFQGLERWIEDSAEEEARLLREEAEVDRELEAGA